MKGLVNLRFGKLQTHFVKNGIALRVSLLFSISVAIVFFYRLGSARVDKGQQPGLRDIATYIDAGANLLNGNDPYLDANYRAGPSLLFFFGLVAKIGNPYLIAWFFQLMVMVGIAYFTKIIADLAFSKHVLFYCIILFLSSTRENLVNIQITGFLALLFALGIKLSTSYEDKNLCRTYLGLLFVGIAVDTKPHIFLLTSVIIFISRKQFSKLLVCFLAICFIHLIESLKYSEFITLSWLKQLVHLNEKRINGSLGESIFLSWIFEILGIDSSAATFVLLATCLILSFFIIMISLRRDVVREEIAFSLLIPSFGIFFHYYDLVLAICVYLAILYGKQSRLFPYLSLFFVVPESVGDFKSILVILMVTVINLFMFEWKFAMIKHILLALLLWFSYGFFLSVLPETISIHSFQMTFTVIILATISLNQLMFCKYEANDKTIVSTVSRDR